MDNSRQGPRCVPRRHRAERSYRYCRLRSGFGTGLEIRIGGRLDRDGADLYCAGIPSAIEQATSAGPDGSSTRISSCKAAPATAAAATVTPDPKERVYLREQSTKEVLEHINSLKPLEKEVVSNQSYVGRWVRWSGRVMSIEPFALNLPSGSATVTVKDSQLITARLEFLPAAHHLVEGIEEGDAIDYEAMVTRIYEYAI